MRRAGLGVGVIALAATGATVPVSEAVVPPDEERRAASARAGSTTTITGGDVVTLPRPVVVRPAARLGTSWVRTTLGPLPAEGAGAVVLSVTATAASRAGAVAVRPNGSTAAGTTTVDYARSRAVTGLSLVKVGKDGTVQVRSTAGSPSVSVRVVGWVPELSNLVVPEKPAAPVAVALSSTPRTVKLTGGTVPDGVVSALVSVRTSATKAGRWTWSRPGDTIPAAGHAVAVGAHRSLVTVTPDASGRIRVKALTGSASAGLQVLGWTKGLTTVEAVKPASLANVRAKALTPVALTSRAGIPASPQDVGFSVNAPRGATVKVWPNASGSGTPVVSAVSDGGALPVWVPVPSGKKVSVKVTGTSATSSVTASGFVSNLGKQSMSFVPKAGTRLLGAGDVAATAANGTVSLAPSAEAVSVGDHLLVRPAGGTPYLGRVADLAVVSGVRRVTFAAAELEDAFDAFDVNYAGAVAQDVKLPGNARAGTIYADPDSIGLEFLGGDNWGCGEAVDPTELLDVEIDYSGDAVLDVSLADRSVDFSLKGRLSMTVSLYGGTTFSCTVSGDLPFSIPLGATGLALSFGGTGSMGFSLPAASKGGLVSLSGTAAVFAGYFYYDGNDGGGQTASVDGSADLNGDGIEGSVSLGIFAKVGVYRPPGVEQLPVDPSGSLTIGTEFTFGRPDPADDPHHRAMRGPHCLDLTQNLFIEVGAQVAVAFFPDVEVTLARWEADPVFLYKGPCWGYSGTISYTRQGQAEDAPPGEVCNTCGFTNYNDSAVKTFIPQPASYGDEVLQPFAWSASIDRLSMSAQQADANGTFRCQVDQLGTAGGTHTFEPSPGGAPATVIGAGLFAEGWYTTSVFSEQPVPVKSVFTGPRPACNQPALTEEWRALFDVSLQGPFGSDLRESARLTHTLTRVPEEGVLVKATYNLTRAEYPRG